MSAPDPFDRLLQQAFHSQPLPPVPPAVLAAWQSESRRGAGAWLWLLPGAVFTAGLLLGVVLAPLGLAAAVDSLQAAFAGIRHVLPANGLFWMAAVAAALAVLLLDGVLQSRRGRRMPP
ncbi:hypothetical protein [Arenimonas sp. GDDSR-1]|uniref:hypothetical protein n=1 Tax=Arenimonas sp. GDDSR-1 TaxID=2950125 RepID=UPI0026278F43|nr:hypothetical protein [Arenimonas sp. GDDSR-1]